jgi:pyruvate/2-oxoglutarate dehydrogenase complex dihydrolipoamide acyltransferase (E2) component
MEECTEGLAQYSVGSHNRARWNVLDMLEWVSRKSYSAHLLCDVDVATAEALTKRLSEEGEKITITAVLLKAISIAQLKYPDSRSVRLPWGLKYTRSVPVAGFTVERLVDGEPAVFFASIANAHNKTLEEIAREISAYGHNDPDSVTQLAKERLISRVPWILRQIYISIGVNIPILREIINPATFGLTSLGKFGMRAPIAPNVTTCVFGIGTIEQKPVVIRGKIKLRDVMSISLSADLNALDMYQAGRLLHKVKVLVESGLKDHLHDSEKIDESQTSNTQKHSATKPVEQQANLPTATRLSDAA